MVILYCGLDHLVSAITEHLPNVYQYYFFLLRDHKNATKFVHDSEEFPPFL